MVHAQQVEEIRLGMRNREDKKEKSLKVVLLRVVFMFQTSLSSRKVFRTKFLQISSRIAMIDV